jgi:hypothetical protein
MLASLRKNHKGGRPRSEGRASWAIRPSTRTFV